MSACCTPPKGQSALDTTREVKFDKALLEECERLPVLVSSREEDVQAWTKEAIRIASACAELKSKANAEIKKALNIKG